MKNRLTFIFFVFIFNLSSAQELKKEAVSVFIECVKTDNVEKLKTLISFPLKRQYPIPDIKDEKDFVKRYKEVFDDSLKSMIVDSNVDKEWSAVGWKGVMLRRGTLWLNAKGKLFAVNYQSKAERLKREKLIKADKKAIHPSLVLFKAPVLIMETKKFRIRIDELMNGNYRYVSWSINSEMNEKPALIVKGGNWIPEGRGGDHRYEFNNGIYKYVCAINVLSAEKTPPASLIVYKNDKKILSQPAQLIEQ